MFEKFVGSYKKVEFNVSLFLVVFSSEHNQTFRTEETVANTLAQNLYVLYRTANGVPGSCFSERLFAPARCHTQKLLFCLIYQLR